jgi:vacuolar-type H+-ATPase subunit B/Vma2
MARNENPPFPRGSTFGSGATVASTDGPQYEGKEFLFEDNNPTTPGSFRSNSYVRCRVVRNNSGGALLGKKIAKLDKGGSAKQDNRSKVSGYTANPADKGYPIDEFLPSAGVPANDLFYIVVDGPALVTTDSAGATNVAVGQVIVPGATTTGSVVTQDTSQTGANLFNQIQNAIGKAMEAINAVSTDFLLDVGGHIR